MKRITAFFIFALLLLFECPLWGFALDDFFPDEKKALRCGNITIGPLPSVAQKPSTQAYNEAVELNNSGLNAMNSNNFELAAKKLEQACKKAPGEASFWQNYIVVLYNSHKYPKKAIYAARMLLAFNENDAQAASIAGFSYLNELKDPRSSIAYFQHALKAQENNAEAYTPGGINRALALAQAYDECNYPDDAFEVLKKYAPKAKNDYYPMYKLGLCYFDRGDYKNAAAAFDAARVYDTEGFASDAWVRARYYGGQLTGLAADCKQVLQRFPNTLNRDSLKRMLFSLSEQDFMFVENIKLKIAKPSALKDLHFTIEKIPNIKNHQQAALIKSEFVSKGHTYAVVPDESNKQILKLSLPQKALARELTLKLTYRIKTKPLFGCCMPAKKPDIKKLSTNPLMCLNNIYLPSLVSKIKSRGGSFVKQAALAVSSGLKYKENFQDKSVDWALSNTNICDCSEFARLLSVVCLKNNIPARIATGFFVKNEFLGCETTIGHAWSEVYFDGKGWAPIDPTMISSMHWAYFTNLLSDQILFCYPDVGPKSRVNIDYVSSNTDAVIDLSASYFIDYWR